MSKLTLTRRAKVEILGRWIVWVILAVQQGEKINARGEKINARTVAEQILDELERPE